MTDLQKQEREVTCSHGAPITKCGQCWPAFLNATSLTGHEREELEKAVENILALRTVDGRGYVPSEGLRALEHKRKVWQLVDFILADRAEHERKATKKSNWIVTLGWYADVNRRTSMNLRNCLIPDMETLEEEVNKQLEYEGFKNDHTWYVLALSRVDWSPPPKGHPNQLNNTQEKNEL